VFVSIDHPSQIFFFFVIFEQYLENQPVIELPVTKNPSGHQKQQSLTTTPENNHHFTPSTPSDRHTLIRSEKEIQIGRKPSLTKAVSNPNLKKAAAQQVEVLHSALEQLKKWETIWKRNVRSSCRFGSSLKGNSLSMFVSLHFTSSTSRTTFQRKTKNLKINGHCAKVLIFL
jgi:hypothetical protein